MGVGQELTGKDPREGGPCSDLPPISTFCPGPQAQLSEQELHYASLQRLPCGEGPDLGNGEREGSREDPSADYTCIAKNKPT